MAIGRGNNNSGSTVAAATGRQGRDSTASGAQGPKERQMQVSQGLHEKAVSEERLTPGEGHDPGYDEPAAS